MPIYEIKENTLQPLSTTTFEAQGIKERSDLQRLLRGNIEVIAPDSMVIAEEFGWWDDSKRRIDLLCVDRDGNLVVVELKRTEDGGHMELQALRYAAMISTMKFEQAVAAHAKFMEANNIPGDPCQRLLDFMELESPPAYFDDVRIVMASAEFSKEITTAVLWLNNHDLDICCVRLKPYLLDGRVLLDAEQVIPLPEAADFQVQVREKQQEAAARESTRDRTKFDVIVGETVFPKLNKRKAVYRLVRALCDKGISPDRITKAINEKYVWLFRSRPGKLTAAEMLEQVATDFQAQGKQFDSSRYFVADEELLFAEEKTWILWNNWGIDTEETLQKLVDAFPDTGIKFRRAEEAAG